MKRRLASYLGLAIIATACSSEPPAEPEPVEPAETVNNAPAATSPDPGVAIGFIAHMHEHARHLDTLNFALADGDLEAAQVPAYWLSRHDTVAGIPSRLQPFVVGMRRSAEAVEEAPNLEIARAAAKQITAECQGCHAAVGI